MNDIRSADKKNSPGGQLFQAVRELTDAHLQFETMRAAKFGLTLSEARCMLIFDNKRYLTVKELSELLFLVKSRIVRLIDQLELKKLVERYPDPADGRIVLLTLTSEGKSVLLKLQECCKETAENFWDNLQYPRKEELPQVLSELSLNFSLLTEREHSSD